MMVAPPKLPGQDSFSNFVVTQHPRVTGDSPVHTGKGRFLQQPTLMEAPADQPSHCIAMQSIAEQAEYSVLVAFRICIDPDQQDFL